MENNKNQLAEDKEEQAHFKEIIHSFKLYNFHATKSLAKSLNFYHELSGRHKDLLFDFEDNCKMIINCIEQNSKVIDLILEDVDCMFENSPTDLLNKNEKENASNDCDIDSKNLMNIDRVYTTLRQIVRDWSSEGAAERENCYGFLISELKSLYLDSSKFDLVNVLVPGSGLGRLAFEIARLGFNCQGNEFSLHMLIVSNFILNKCSQKDEFSFHPYAHHWSNNLNINDQLRQIKFPDVCPFEYNNHLNNFSMAAGDFLEIYDEKNSWDSIITCFFIDTAHNIIDYIEKIWYLLKPGGYWLNLGPLLYHFSGMSGEESIELTYEQIKRILEKIGFKILKEKTDVTCKYLDNNKSMLRYNYSCVLFVLQKPN